MNTYFALKKSWKEMKEFIDKESKEIAENEMSIQILENNLGPSTNTETLKQIVLQKKTQLQDIIHDFSSVHNNILQIKSECINKMKKYLDMYKDIILTLGVTTQEPLDSGLVAEFAKLIYPNILDNHQIRPDPSIHGVNKVPKIPQGYSNTTISMPSNDAALFDEYFKIYEAPAIVSQTNILEP